MEYDLESLVSDAHRAWELLQHEEAAELFFEASRVERSKDHGHPLYGSPNQAFSYEIRGGICLFDSGKVDEAVPVLSKAIEFDWKAARLWSDRHMTEWAVTRLLLNLAGQNRKIEFQELFDRAIAKGRELTYPFPTIVANQRKLLTACIGVGDRVRCKIVCSSIAEKHLKLDKELQLLKKEAEHFISSGFWRRIFGQN